ncbi:MAG: N-acetyltransferase [Prevotellaceae bacterium]|jgi:predicted GNAT family acetyltransferase|nr:N-acetyltransferase [Prevotellaceae bacterium]
MKILHEKGTTGGAFIAYTDDDNEIGGMTYMWLNERQFAIDHTFVSPEYRGQGVADLLLKEAVDFARNEGLNIRPICSFAVKKLTGKSQYADLIV